MRTRVTELLGCRYRILQGARGVICNPELVAAVSEAGGFGWLATAFAADLEADSLPAGEVAGRERADPRLVRSPAAKNMGRKMKSIHDVRRKRD
jgi:NAD(P)H-dependent flavin oxidoreductase YrpB (nitropropane dioxygenase family)